MVLENNQNFSPISIEVEADMMYKSTFVISATSLASPYPPFSRRLGGLDAGVVWSGSVRNEQDQTDAAGQDRDRKGGRWKGGGKTPAPSTYSLG